MTTNPPAENLDLAAIQNGERVLGEMRAELKSLLKESKDWLETVKLAIAFLLVVVTAAAPLEMKVLNFKIAIPPELRNPFLVVLAAALVFRLVRGRLAAVLARDAINARFKQLSDALTALRDRLADSKQGHQDAFELVFQRGTQEAQLDGLHWMFDVYEVLDGEDTNGAAKSLSMTPADLRTDGEQLLRRRRDSVLARGQAGWYPEHLWQQACGAVLDLAVTEREIAAAEWTVPVVAVPLGGDTTPADTAAAGATEAAEARVQALRARRDAAMNALSAHISEHASQPVTALVDKGQALKALVAQVAAIRRQTWLYWQLGRLGLFISLIVPTMVAIVAAAAVLQPYLA